MELTNNVARLIADLEPCIGENCYNKSSYNGYTGVTGLHFRYPVRYLTKEGTYIKSRYSKDDLDLKNVKKMFYLTGTTEIYVGTGLFEVLDMLEKRFHLDFNKLIEEECNMRKN